MDVAGQMHAVHWAPAGRLPKGAAPTFMYPGRYGAIFAATQSPRAVAVQQPRYVGGPPFPPSPVPSVRPYPLTYFPCPGALRTNTHHYV